MIFNAIISAVSCQNSANKKSNRRNARHKYIIDKYHERSISERYFK